VWRHVDSFGQLPQVRGHKRSKAPKELHRTGVSGSLLHRHQPQCVDDDKAGGVCVADSDDGFGVGRQLGCANRLEVLACWQRLGLINSEFDFIRSVADYHWHLPGTGLVG